MSARRPRVLSVGRTRFELPMDEATRRKYDALRAELDLHVLAAAGNGADQADDWLRLARPLRPRLLDGPLFYASLPVRIARELRRVRPDSLVAESPFIGFAALLGRALARDRVPLTVEVHGEWRGATRLYGSRFRELLGPLSDRVATVALRRAERVRALSPFTVELLRKIGVEATDAFPAYTDLAEFASAPLRPLPPEPRLLFVGVLERYKNVDGLVEAWRRAAPRVPDATLRIVGTGRETALVEHLLRDFPDRVTWTPSLPQRDVARAMEESSALVLPSRSEGLPRVVIESLARGRPVIATPVGGVPDIVFDGVNGVIVEPGDTDALADAIVRVLGSREELERLASRARETAEPWLQSPEEFARRFAALVA